MLYQRLHKISKQATILGSISNMLEWDQETYMPHGGISLRSDQLEQMALLTHKEKTSRKFEKALSALIDLDTGHIKEGNLTPPQSAAVRAWRKDFLKMTKLPAAFVKKMAQTVSTSLHMWAEAKQKNDFALFAPFLDKIISLNRKKADYLGYKDHPYDALLDLYEPAMTTAFLKPLFHRLREKLTPLVKETYAKPVLEGDFPEEAQLRFAKKLLTAMGFDDKICRLDQSAHPFCVGLYPKDTRMTTHLHRSDCMANIFSVIHEGGHGLYNHGLPVDHFGSPLCESASLGIDESQSRLWETIIGHSKPFWLYFYPLLQKEFPHFQSISFDDFYQAINKVKPSLIRIHADEVTYSLHIILRFYVEIAFVEGSLKAKELPEFWNAKMQEYLGVSPQSEREGCLQDIHWSMGNIGYFPTYTLGNLYAAQFFAVFTKAFPTWESRIASGDFTFLREWLKENIHQWGRMYTPSELCQRISGKPLDESAYIAYLTNKFGK